jgi:hypothetical protein
MRERDYEGGRIRESQEMEIWFRNPLKENNPKEEGFRIKRGLYMSARPANHNKICPTNFGTKVLG